MPQPLSIALVLVRLLFGITVLGGVGVLMAAASVGAVDGELLGLLMFAAVPGVAGLVLARAAWSGGSPVWWGLLGTQGWLVIGALRTLGEGGGPRGVTQLVLPVVIVGLLCRPASRQWFLLAESERAEHRPFRLARMIRWRGDGGQTAIEYLGLVLLVVAIIGALVVSGIAGQITGGLQAAVCEIAGTSCSAPGNGSGTDVNAGDSPRDPDTPGEETDPGTDPGTDGGADGDGGTGGPAGDTGDPSGVGGVTTADGENTPQDKPKDDADTKADVNSEDGGGDGEKKDEGCTSGFGAFLSCAGHQTGGFVKGVVVDGVWGDITGTVDTVIHPIKAWDGIKDYGKSLGDQWSEDSKDAGAKWDKGDYWGALVDWGGATVSTPVTVLDDVFVGDDVRDMWNKGDGGQAVGTVAWNIGSLFIPGYGEGKLVGKLGKLGKLGKISKVSKVAELAGKASEAAAKARKAAKAGDVAGAERAAQEARKHADDAAEEAGLKGCTVGSGPLGGQAPGSSRVTTAAAGTSTPPPTVVTAVYTRGPGTSVQPVLLSKKCPDEDPEKVKAAQEAEKQAKEAEEAAKAAKREAERKRLAKMAKPSWYPDLRNPRAGSVDGGSGKWKAKKSDTYSYPQEMGARYQEQVSGVRRGKEYEVPLDKLDGKPVEFDGWDAKTGTYIETKWGYEGERFYNKETKELTATAANRWLKQAARQLDAAGGKPVVWHFASEEVADAARQMFEDNLVDVTVRYTPVKP